MKVLVFISVLLCVALSVMAAVVPVEEENSAPVLEGVVEVQEKPAEAMGVLEVNEAVEAMPEEVLQMYSVPEAEVELEEAVRPEGLTVYCPDGWFRHQSRCFLFVNTPMSWHSAEDHCNQFQAHLASVHNPQEYRFLQQMISMASQSTAWLGGFNLEGRWRWIDGEGMYYTNWHSLSSASSNPCMYMRSTVGWYNTACSSNARFICARNPKNC